MAQVKENYANSGDFQVFMPKNSTNITSGDVVAMPRKSSPRSRAYLGVLNRISPISSKCHAPYCVGVVHMDFNTNTVGATLYAAATSNQALPVYKRGVFKLAMVDTSGSAGDLVRYSSGGTGAQLFTVDNSHKAWAVGMLEKSYTGATANDTQYVRLIEKDQTGPDLAFWLENRVLQGCKLKRHSVANSRSLAVDFGATSSTGDINAVIIQGKVHFFARDTNVSIGPQLAGAASTVKMRAIVVDSGGCTARTCSASKKAVTWSTSAITAGLFVPKVITSGEVIIGYAVAWSTTARSYNASSIRQLYGPSEIPSFGNWSV